jgi:diguanylate cyclase (GGDEF)-like protein
MRASGWRVHLAIGAAAVGAYVLLPSSWWKTGVGALIGLSGVVGLLVGVSLHRPRLPVLWLLLAGGLLLEVAGDLIRAIYERVLHNPDQFPSLGDAAYLAGCPLIALCILGMVRVRTAGKDRANWIDATIVASGFALLSWVFVMAPTAASSSELTWFGRLIALAYPVWDVLYFMLLMRLLAGLGARLPALRLLVGASALWLITDTVYAILLLHSAYTSENLVNVPWLLGFVVFGAAALHPSMGKLTQPMAEPDARLTWRRLGLLASATLIAPILLMVQTVLARGQVDGLAIGTASAVLFLLVVMRMAGLVRRVEDQAVELAALAQRDGLTGIPNRRVWDSELPVAMDRTRRDRVPLSVALIDLDHFKRFNDEYGHQAGDRLLKSATAAWTAAVRTTDRLCRYGGEEFGVLLPDATVEQAMEVLERVRAVTPLAQTFSAGVACWDTQEISDELVARADRALYAAKAAGRDRIASADRPSAASPSVSMP